LLAIGYPLALMLLPDSPLLMVPFDLAATAAIVVILRATGHCRPLVQLATVLAVLITTTNVLAVVSPEFGVSTSFAIVRTALLIGFFFAMTIVVLSRVLDPEHVTMEKVLGGICAYLFIGSTWGFFYVLVVLVDPDAFRGAVLGVPSAGERLNWYDLDLAEFTYFSYVTLTTLGYGDITPRSVAAQMLVWTETLVGQIYLAVLVARLVSLQIVHSGIGGGGGEPRSATGAPGRLRGAPGPSSRDPGGSASSGEPLARRRPASPRQRRARVR
jgi:hypothetical protein